jgi:MFS family permease
MRYTADPRVDVYIDALLAHVRAGYQVLDAVRCALAFGDSLLGDNAHYDGVHRRFCSENERSREMGQLGATAGIGVVAGPLLGGLLSADSLGLPFLSAPPWSFSRSCWRYSSCPNRTRRRSPQSAASE